VTVHNSSSRGVNNRLGVSAAVLQDGQGAFQIVRSPLPGRIESQWQACLADSDHPTHYAAPAFFLEPAFRNKRPFAILSIVDDEVTGVLTGVHDGDRVQSGLSVRPQIAFSRRADPARAMANLVAGLLVEAESAKLVDLFVWSDMEALVASRLYKRRCEGVVMLDLSRGPDALFKTFSENKRRNIKKAIKYGVSVEPAKSRDEISAYHAIYVDWSRRKALPVLGEEDFQDTFALTENRVLFLARHEGKIIAGVVIRFFPRGIMEYAANSSMENALRVRPNDLLHWRAIEWGCGEGMIKYSLGGAHLFLRKFGGPVVPTTRCRLDKSLLRRHALSDWLADKTEQARHIIPEELIALGRSLRTQVSVRASGRRRSA
jgi:hypothetical protein